MKTVALMDLQAIEPQMPVCVEIYSGVLQGNLNFSTLFSPRWLYCLSSYPLADSHSLLVAHGNITKSLSKPSLPHPNPRLQASDSQPLLT